jgi:predicted ATP-grasp superfamily ATP-dependent carboligase
MSMPIRRGGALILDADVRALGIARSLGRRGVPVDVLWRAGDRIALHSRYVRRTMRWPSDAVGDRLAYLQDLGRTTHGGWTLFATHDEGAAMVARHHEELSRSFRLDTPAWPTFVAAYDKHCTYGLADSVGVPHPATSYPRTVRDLQDATGLVFPVILKPSVKHEENAFTVDKAWPAGNPEELVRRYEAARRLVPPETIMVQQLIPGGGECQFSFAALCRDGRPLAWMVARRSRQYPRTFGHSSSLVETVEDEDVAQTARRLLAGSGYTGLIEVEFKRDPRTGSLLLLDVNPRVWTWLGLGEEAGVDFPYLSWLRSQGRAVPETRARVGARWMRPATDVLAAAGEIRDGRMTLREYARELRRPTAMSPFAADDPLPGAIDLPMATLRTLRRRVRLLRSSVQHPGPESAGKRVGQHPTWSR